MWPTEAEWYLMKQYAQVGANNRPPEVKALYQKYESWRAAHPGWQQWDAPTFRQTKKAETQQQQPSTAAPPPPGTSPPPPDSAAPPPSGGGATPPGPGASQDPIAAGGVWWGGKFYSDPHSLRVALGYQNYPQQWAAWLARNPAIAAWVQWYNTTGGQTPPGQDPNDPGGLPPDDWVDTDGDGIPDTPGPPDDSGQPGPDQGGTTTPPGASGPTDWSSVLGLAGLPADIMAQVSRIFTQTADPNQAVALALAYVRGTAWYAQTFVGINDGIQKGLFTDERGYRDYRNALEQVYKQWTGGALGQESLLSALREGVSPEVVARRFEGRALVEAARPDLQYVAGAFGTRTDLGRAEGASTRLTEGELESFGQQQAGLGSPMGIKVERALQLAQQRLQRMFEGVEATPQLALGTRGNLFAPGLRPGTQRPDIPA